MTRDKKTDLVRINDEFNASIVLSRCRPTSTGSKRWIIRFDTTLNPDLTIAIRLNDSASEILDYYLLPMNMPKDLSERMLKHQGEMLYV